jgi:hypothetical protein
MRIAIRHELIVSPPPGTGHLVMQLLLTPRDGPTQAVKEWVIEMAGMDNAARFDDAYGNRVHLVNQSKPDRPLSVVVSGMVDTRDMHGVLGRPGGEPVPALYKRMTPLTKVPVTLYGKFRGAKENRLDVLHALMLRVSETLHAPLAEAQRQMEGGQTQSQNGQSQTQATASGSVVEPVAAMSADGTPAREAEGHEVVVRLPRPPATDFAHSFVGAARALGIPARYVTGYLVGDDEEPAAFHAWAEAFDDKLGWIGFDAMLELCPTDRHVRLAVGLDALSAAPLRCVPAGDGVPEQTVSIEQV